MDCKQCKLILAARRIDEIAKKRAEIRNLPEFKQAIHKSLDYQDAIEDLREALRRVEKSESKAGWEMSK